MSEPKRPPGHPPRPRPVGRQPLRILHRETIRHYLNEKYSIREIQDVLGLKSTTAIEQVRREWRNEQIALQEREQAKSLEPPKEGIVQPKYPLKAIQPVEPLPKDATTEDALRILLVEAWDALVVGVRGLADKANRPSGLSYHEIKTLLSIVDINQRMDQAKKEADRPQPSLIGDLLGKAGVTDVRLLVAEIRNVKASMEPPVIEGEVKVV